MSQKSNDYNKKLSLSELLNDKRFNVAISIIIAFILWAWVAIEKSPETQRTITDVPVQINLENSVPEQLGLSVFGNSEFTVDVTVKGKKYVTSSLNADDIVVTANTNYVDGSGVKNLQLKVSQKDSNNDYEITSYSINYIEVYFDTYKEVELPVIGNIETTLMSIVPDDCIAGDTVLSKNTVLISGPATEVNKVVSVVANITVDDVLEKTTTFDPVFKLETSDGSSLEYVKMETEENDITVTVPVLKEVTLPTVVEFRNAPSYFINNPLPYTIYPASVKVAVPVDMVDTTTEFVVSTIDFADISSSINTFNIDVNQLNSTLKITDKNVSKFTVKIDASEMVSRTISIPFSNFTVKHIRDDYDVSINQDKDISVKIVGKESHIDSISAENLSILVDTTEQELTDSTTM
ncbi:MAG: hypothetical protein IJZ16_07820, partial [Clostridia bacterium]|nr:hypothetical protein [Clostridia bacterium]